MKAKFVQICSNEENHTQTTKLDKHSVHDLHKHTNLPNWGSPCTAVDEQMGVSLQPQRCLMPAGKRDSKKLSLRMKATQLHAKKNI